MSLAYSETGREIEAYFTELERLRERRRLRGLRLRNLLMAVLVAGTLGCDLLRLLLPAVPCVVEYDDGTAAAAYVVETIDGIAFRDAAGVPRVLAGGTIRLRQP